MPQKTKQSQQSDDKKEYFEVLLESVHSDVKIIAGQSTEHTRKLGKVDSRLDTIEEDISTMKIGLEFIKNELK